MAAVDFGALLRAIQEVLGQGTGLASTIPAAYRLSFDAHPDQAPSVLARRARTKPRASVLIQSQLTRNLSTVIDVVQRDVRVRLDVTYFAGREEKVEARRRAQARAADDGLRISAALEWPGNLATTAGPDSTPTGLAGGALQFESWELTEPTSDDRVLEAQGFFRGVVELTRPA